MGTPPTYQFSTHFSKVFTLCIRGARSSIGAYTRAPPPMDLVQVESRLSESHAGCVTLFFFFCLLQLSSTCLCAGVVGKGSPSSPG